MSGEYQLRIADVIEIDGEDDLKLTVVAPRFDRAGKLVGLVFDGELDIGVLRGRLASGAWQVRRGQSRVTTK